MVKYVGKQYDKDREKRSAPSSRGSVRAGRSVLSPGAPCGVLSDGPVTPRAHPHTCSPWHEVTGAAIHQHLLALLLCTPAHLSSSVGTATATKCDTHNAAEGETLQEPPMLLLHVCETPRVLSCGPLLLPWVAPLLLMWTFLSVLNENKTNQPTKTTKRSRKPGKSLANLCERDDAAHNAQGSPWSGAGWGGCSPWSCGWTEDQGLHQCQATTVDSFPSIASVRGRTQAQAALDVPGYGLLRTRQT